MAKAALKLKTPKLIKLDIGCGSKKYRGENPEKPEDDWVGIDQIAFPGVDHVFDAGETRRWPFADGSVAEAYTNHFFEHLNQVQRVNFANNLWRVLVPGGKCKLVMPHWSSCRAYGDPTHAWPPVSEFAFFYFDRDWRIGNPAKNMTAQAPHTDKRHWKQGFDCDFDIVIANGLNPMILTKPKEWIEMAMVHFKEAVLDLHVMLIKKA
jgi:hypothetical protein